MAAHRAPLSQPSTVRAVPIGAVDSGAVAGVAPSLGLAERRLIRRAGDLLMVVAPWLAAWLLLGGELHPPSLLAAAGAWSLAAMLLDTYRAHRGARFAMIALSTGATLAVAAALFGLLVAAMALLGLAAVPRPATQWGFLADLALVAGLLGAWVLAYRHLVQHPELRRRAVILGANASARATARTLRRALARDYTLVGFVAEDGTEDLPHVLDGAKVLGDARHLLDVIDAHRANHIILACEDRLDADMIGVLADARERGVEITSMFDLYANVTGRMPIEDGPAYRLAALTDHRERAHTLYGAIKRGMDVMIALVGLAGVALLIPFIALANAIESPGPLFYSQTRVGRGGRTFRILKFRSMIVDAERPGQARWAQQHDTRITRMGRILRRTHLDETPQLWNILVGDMSFVGPRPERPEMIRDLRAHIPCYSARHAVRPGLTGWAQVNYPYGNTQRDALVKLEYDLYYIQNRSLWLDILCVLRTVRTVVLLTGY